MTSDIEAIKAALDDLKKFRHICSWRKRKTPQKHMQN